VLLDFPPPGTYRWVGIRNRKNIRSDVNSEYVARTGLAKIINVI